MYRQYANRDFSVSTRRDGRSHIKIHDKTKSISISDGAFPFQIDIKGSQLDGFPGQQERLVFIIKLPVWWDQEMESIQWVIVLVNIRNRWSHVVVIRRAGKVLRWIPSFSCCELLQRPSLFVFLGERSSPSLVAVHLPLKRSYTRPQPSLTPSYYPWPWALLRASLVRLGHRVP